MKVSCVTVSDFAVADGSPRSIRSARGSLALGVTFVLLACHQGQKPGPLGRALANPPTESIVLRFPSRELPTRTAIRQSLFNAGIQIDSENRKSGWMRAQLGGHWEGGQLYKQWFIVASYYLAPDSSSTVVILRGIEQANSYLATTASRYGGPALVATSGSARVGLITDATQGRARVVWETMERVAFRLGESGAERVGQTPPER